MKTDYGYQKLNDLLPMLSFRRAVIGLDLGSKTIGIAKSDVSLTIASGLTTIRRKKLMLDLQNLNEICQSHAIEAIVIGWAINMDGSEGRRIQSIKTFASNMVKVVKLPYVFWDERLSTLAVTRTLLEADISRQKRSQLVDKLAATYILQGALDYINVHKNNINPRKGLPSLML